MSYHMDVEGWIAVYPLVLWRTDDEVERECVVESLFLGEVEVSAVDVMEHGYEHLAFACVNHCVMLQSTMSHDAESAD